MEAARPLKYWFAATKQNGVTTQKTTTCENLELHIIYCHKSYRTSDINFPYGTQLRAGIPQWYSAGLRAGSSGVRVPVGVGNFFPHHRGRTGSETHPAFSLGVKRPEREADNSSSSSARSRMHGDMPPLPQYVSMSWCPIKA
jgi:hypothetical protein